MHKINLISSGLGPDHCTLKKLFIFTSSPNPRNRPQIPFCHQRCHRNGNYSEIGIKVTFLLVFHSSSSFPGIVTSSFPIPSSDRAELQGNVFIFHKTNVWRLGGTGDNTPWTNRCEGWRCGFSREICSFLGFPPFSSLLESDTVAKKRGLKFTFLFGSYSRVTDCSSGSCAVGYREISIGISQQCGDLSSPSAHQHKAPRAPSMDQHGVGTPDNPAWAKWVWGSWCRNDVEMMMM